MPLAAATRLGPYEIVAPLGAGGMGEVYRARDTRLGRDVAIKVLPASLSSSPEIRARFEREARTISSLNHPHICTLHDVGREGDTDFLVMELVEGETLAQRLARGALPPAETLKLGEQIADALDRAHRAGVIHRDLKPGNVMLTKSGAKLMDFGLARATGLVAAAGSGVSAGAAFTQSPTVGAPLTAEGTIVGTFQYMAPEQLEGKEADARSDIWALGCVLYEMATGRRAFEGRSQASLIAAILERTPDPPSAIAPRTPPPLDHVVSRCLAKEPDDRWQNARDVMHELRAISGASVMGAAAASRMATTARLVTARGVALVALIAAAAAALGAFLGPALVRPRLAEAPMILTLGMPTGLTWSGLGNDLDLTQDGRSLVFVAWDTTGVPMLWVRALNQERPRALPGTQNAAMPFWSPDGRWIGFFAGGKLRKVAMGGGNPDDICPAASGRGGDWNRDGVIIFAPGAEGPIYQVSAQGGTPVAVTALDTAKHEYGHRVPRFLPDGRRFLYATLPAVDKLHEIYLGTLGSTKRSLVVRCDGTPEMTRDGWLLFRKGGMLTARRFDPGSARLTGEEKPLLRVSQGAGIQASSSSWTSSTGMLAYMPDIPLNERLAWVDRSGREETIPGLPVGGWFFPRLSPDGARIACPRAGSTANATSGNDLWTLDPARRLATRLTFEPNTAISPVWSADQRTILYTSNKEGTYALYTRPASGGGESQFIARGSGLVMQPTDWARDGRLVVYQVEDARTASDIWLLSMDDRKSRPLLHSEFNEGSARISPDGRWLAYHSDESGRFEVYLQSFPGLGGKVQVSTNGGFQPQWSGDGRELFFDGLDDAVMVAGVRNGAALDVDPPVRLFRLRTPDVGWSVAPDGRRFLFVLAGEEAARYAPGLVVNWRGMVGE